MAAILVVTVALLVLGMAAYAWFAVVMLALPIVNNRTVHRARMHAAQTQPHQ